MREKLIELLEDVWSADTWEEIADYLIANGVTISYGERRIDAES